MHGTIDMKVKCNKAELIGILRPVDSGEVEHDGGAWQGRSQDIQRIVNVESRDRHVVSPPERDQQVPADEAPRAGDDYVSHGGSWSAGSPRSTRTSATLSRISQVPSTSSRVVLCEW